MKAKCPHCGNTNLGLFEDNGARGEDLVFLCVRRMPWDECSWTHQKPIESDLDERGLVICGAQFSPEGEGFDF